MLKRSLLMGALLLGFSLFWAGGAKADSMGSLSLTNCGGGQSGCPAATYSFDIGTTTASLTIHITGPVTAGTNNFIEGVNLGFTPSNTITVTGVTGPAGDYSSPYSGATWSFTTGSLSNGGCGTNSGSFICAMSASNSGNGAEIVNGGAYQWTWTYDPINLNNTSSSVHIGANYNPANGLIVSQTTAVPEASTMSLLLLGLVGLAFAGTARRRFAPSQA